MTAPVRLLALGVLLAASPAMAEDVGLYAPLDLRPPAVATVRRPVIAMPPLPRLRPVHVASTRAMPPGVSPEIVGSIPVPHIVTSAKPVPIVAIAVEPAAPPMPPAPPPRALASLPPAAVPVQPPAAPAIDPAEPDELGSEPAMPFAGKPALPAVPPVKGEGSGTPPEIAAPPPVVAEPYELVRTLQSLQDRIAQGSADALLGQRTLRARIDAEFAAADAKVWQDKRNAAAAVVYVLSGGAPAILERLKSLDPPPAVDMKLLGGALAYVEGSESDAATLLDGINAFDLPPSTGGLVALAQSALAVRSDAAKAMRLLDIARLLAPGTLVEEAALRREIFVADQTSDPDKVLSLGRQYLERFRHSVYAGNFRNRFAAALSHMDLTRHPEESARIEDMLASVEPAAQCQLYLTLALASVVKGNTAAAVLAADRAAGLAAAGSVEEARARLYRAAGRAGDAKTFDGAVADFAGTGRMLLPPADQALYDAVAATIDGVKSGTAVPAGQAAQLDATDTGLTPLFTRAADALKTVDALLTTAQK